MIGVLYPDKYAVEEVFQLLKIPWEWYDSSEKYDVVIVREKDLNFKAIYDVGRDSTGSLGIFVHGCTYA